MTLRRARTRPDRKIIAALSRDVGDAHKINITLSNLFTRLSRPGMV
jgi:hypothetical protein